ncbi:hypothetical protein DES53_112104 [Roseimicrobium gellanilyticum]|uniref:Uncharacterized protein n=1 Tax=Roseimicrobium gellanilyticum TaxID=748857 RepID=A0A366H7S3_9BACT|nr:hypothetical protein [Roseimicrobium gellanilyticum]RBP38106.1 hypothetical protein DES53_112104 [Roseimicrobium gellanilyticum]
MKLNPTQNIAITLMLCIAMLVTSQKSQAAPRHLNAAEKHDYAERTETLPAGFANEEGEFTAEALMIVLVVLLVIGCLYAGSNTSTFENRASENFNQNFGTGVGTEMTTEDMRGYSTPSSN